MLPSCQLPAAMLRQCCVLLCQVAPLLESSELRSLSLRLLYVVSCWRASRVCFLDAITTVRSLVDLLLQPAPRPDGEEQQLLLAILINISHVPAITQVGTLTLS